jgi:hypothetical protein
VGLIDNLHRDGIAFSLSLVQEMGYRSFSDEEATLFSFAVAATRCPALIPQRESFWMSCTKIRE